MTEEHRERADHMYKHIPDQKKRYEIYARGPGQKLEAARAKAPVDDDD